MKAVIGAVCVVAAAGAVGCAGERGGASLKFAVSEPARCSAESAIDLGAAKHDRDVGVVRDELPGNQDHGLEVRVEGAWLAVAGESFKAPGAVSWAGAARAQQKLAIAVIAEGALWVTLQDEGEPARFQQLGPASAADSAPDLTIQGDTVAIAWEDGAAAHLATSSGARFVQRELRAPGAHAMDPRVATLGNGALMVLWREGDVESHGLRAQLFDANARELSAPMTLLPGFEVMRAEVASRGAGRAAISAMIATPSGGELMMTRVVCSGS